MVGIWHAVVMAFTLETHLYALQIQFRSGRKDHLAQLVGDEGGSRFRAPPVCDAPTDKPGAASHVPLSLCRQGFLGTGRGHVVLRRVTFFRWEFPYRCGWRPPAPSPAPRPTDCCSSWRTRSGRNRSSRTTLMVVRSSRAWR